MIFTAKLSQHLLDRFSANFYHNGTGSYLIAENTDLTVFFAEGTLPWQPILGSKLAKSAYLPTFLALAF